LAGRRDDAKNKRLLLEVEPLESVIGGCPERKTSREVKDHGTSNQYTSTETDSYGKSTTGGISSPKDEAKDPARSE